MTYNSKEIVDNKIAGYAMNRNVVCVCVVLALKTIQISAQYLLMSVLLTLLIRDAFRGHRLPIHLYPTKST